MAELAQKLLHNNIKLYEKLPKLKICVKYVKVVFDTFQILFWNLIVFLLNKIFYWLFEYSCRGTFCPLPYKFTLTCYLSKAYARKIYIYIYMYTRAVDYWLRYFNSRVTSIKKNSEISLKEYQIGEVSGSFKNEWKNILHCGDICVVTGLCLKTNNSNDKYFNLLIKF